MDRTTGKRVRSKIRQIAVHLARFLNRPVAGYLPTHQENPFLDRPHWWREIHTWIHQIEDEELTNRQLRRELRQEFTNQALQEIQRALQDTAAIMNEDTPDFLLDN